MSIDINKYVNSYEFDYTLPGSNKIVKFKPITTGQLKKLLPYENETDPMVIDELLDDLINECIVSDEFDISKIYLEDRFSLLIEIRKKSKGETYDFTYNCPKCKQLTPISLNLNDLVTKQKKLETKPFKLNDSLSFYIDQITREEQKHIYKLIKERKIENKDLEKAELATYTYATSMRKFITPEGETEVPLKDKINIIDGVFTDKQYKKYAEWFEINKFGTEFEFEFSCSNPECKNKEIYNIPLNNFFV